MTHYYYYDSKTNKFYGPLDRMPPDKNDYFGFMGEDEVFDVESYDNDIESFLRYLSSAPSIPHTFTGHSRVVPEGEIEWRYEVQERRGHGGYVWKQCENTREYEMCMAKYRRRVATPKITEGGREEDVVTAMQKKIDEITKAEDQKKSKQREIPAVEFSELKKEKTVPKDDDPEGAEIYCEKCKKDTYQLFTNDGMKCSICSTSNPFGNCSKEDFARYIKDLSLRNDFRSVDDINAYFDKKRAEIDKRFDDYIAGLSGTHGHTSTSGEEAVKCVCNTGEQAENCNRNCDHGAHNEPLTAQPNKPEEEQDEYKIAIRALEIMAIEHKLPIDIKYRPKMNTISQKKGWTIKTMDSVFNDDSFVEASRKACAFIYNSKGLNDGQ